MATLEQKIDAMLAYVLANGEAGRAEVRQRMQDLLNGSPAPGDENTADLDTVIYEVLKDIGVTANLRGYEYITEAIKLIITNPGYNMMGIYTQIGDKHHIAYRRVERGMRNAIEKLFIFIDPDIFKKYFGNTIDASIGKPTNGEFVHQIAHYIKLNMREDI